MYTKCQNCSFPLAFSKDTTEGYAPENQSNYQEKRKANDSAKWGIQHRIKQRELPGIW